MVVCSHEGREPVAPARVERTGARARGQHATHPGGVGAPPGSQYELPLSLFVGKRGDGAPGGATNPYVHAFLRRRGAFRRAVRRSPSASGRALQVPVVFASGGTGSQS